MCLETKMASSDLWPVDQCMYATYNIIKVMYITPVFQVFQSPTIAL